jgi:CRP/FNR family transcriptional regulator, cyclic AMP receptor protein
MNHYVTSKLIGKHFRNGQAQRVRKGEVIVGWETEPEYIYFIEVGFIKVYSISVNGEQFVQLIHGKGELFPLVWAYCRVRKDLYYEALEESLLFRVPVSSFDNFAVSSTVAAHTLARHLAQQFVVYTDRLNNLQYRKPNQRLAYRLLFLAGRFGVRDGNDVVIEGPFTHQLIADSINLARETVSREFEVMEQQGLVTRGHRRIVIKKMYALRRMCSTTISLTDWGIAPPLLEAPRLEQEGTAATAWN